MFLYLSSAILLLTFCHLKNEDVLHSKVLLSVAKYEEVLNS